MNLTDAGTDFQRISTAFRKAGVTYELDYASDDMIADDALKHKAVIAICLGGGNGSYLNFNIRGKFVGQSTSYLDSFVKRRGGKRGRRKSTGRAKNSRRSEGARSVGDALARIKQITY